MGYTITAAEWKRYKDKLRQISEKAAEKMQAYAQSHNFQMDQEMIDYAYALATKYGEASAELACEMYDELADYWNAQVPPAEPATTASYQEVSKAMNGCMKQSPSGNLISGVADRLVKQAGADTTIKNAIRDGAYWAWIPSGDTCAFCITLASRGWQKASKKVLKGDHAEHIHAHCDCTFAIAFRQADTEKYPFYDPDKYYRQYIDANGNINEMRRKMYPDIAEARNARRRELYSLKKEVSTYGSFASPESVDKHFLKHKNEFEEEITKEEYVEFAEQFKNRELSDTVQIFTRSDGSTAKYDIESNEFEVINSDGSIRTYFKPIDGIKYWEFEHERNK